MAPLPKPPGARRRRNAGVGTWKFLPREGRTGKVPPLPGDDWLDSTRVWWAELWHSPMALTWQDADVQPLVRLVSLRDAFMRGELPVSGLAALQALEDRFGLSPKSRRALQWEIASAAQAVAASEPAVRRLRAVDATTGPAARAAVDDEAS